MVNTYFARTFFTAAAIALAGAAVSGARTLIGNIGEQVYSEKVGDVNVNYEEGRYMVVNRHGGKYINRMTITDPSKNVVYIFEDILHANSIQPTITGNRPLKEGSLERITIKTGDTTNIYVHPLIQPEFLVPGPRTFDTNTLEGRHQAEVFDRGNLMYNNIRGDITDTIRNAQIKRYQGISNLLVIQEQINSQ